MSAVIRVATAADLDAVMAIERASFPTDAWSEGSMRETLADPQVLAFAAEEGDALVGYAAVMAASGAVDADVLTIAVAERSRGRGSGRALLEGLLDGAAARGARRVFLEVRADNPTARGLYERSGFVAVGVRRHYYQPDDVDAIVMCLEPASAGAAT